MFISSRLILYIEAQTLRNRIAIKMHMTKHIVVRPPKMGMPRSHDPVALKVCASRAGPSITPILRPVMIMPKASATLPRGPKITLGIANRHTGTTPAVIP